MTAIATTASAQAAATVAAALSAINRPASACGPYLTVARSVRFCAGPAAVPVAYGFVTAAPAGGGGGAVTLPASWLAVALPASGYIGPSLAQLALVRGAVAVFDAATGQATIGGAVLLSVRGKVFAFSGRDAFDQWAAINAARLVSECALVSALPEAAAATARANKAAAAAIAAARVVNNAATVVDAGKRAALVREADWLYGKWA